MLLPLSTDFMVTLKCSLIKDFFKKLGFIVLLGRDFRVGGVPWGIHLIGDEIPTSDPAWTTRNQYKNYWGYELMMLEDAAKYMDFTYRFLNINKP